MDFLFIEPAALPGGQLWQQACGLTPSASTEQAVTNSTILATSRIVKESSSKGILSEALRCDLSPSAGFIQVLFFLFIYGGILFKASQLIADGSELLLLVPSLRNIVGSVVLPILGAVPDGAIVLFSGLGQNAQEELSVGVGALAGSTIMLLTIPWFLSVLAGRVNINPNGRLTYNRRPHKLIPPNYMHPTHTGVQPQDMVRISGKIMLITSISYFVIQGAAISTGKFFAATVTEEDTKNAAAAERGPALFCFVISVAFFFSYLYYQVVGVSDVETEFREDLIEGVKEKAILNGEISLSAAFSDLANATAEIDESTGLVESQRKQERLNSMLKGHFNSYDHDHNGAINTLELQNLMRDLGEVLSGEEAKAMHEEMDINGDGNIEWNEFREKMPEYIKSKNKAHRENGHSTTNIDGLESGTNTTTLAVDEHGNEDEEVEVPNDLRHDDPATQIKNVMKRAFSMMTIGTILVLIFSDPMVGVMSEVGRRMGISAFYISFMLAPLASNASEFLAAYSYASKKTRKTITISFSTLLGAAIMNNTFVLAIFMLLITVKNLAWQFTAETIAILFVEIVMGIMSQKKVLTLRDGYVVLALFPFSIFLVAFLENVVGLD